MNDTKTDTSKKDREELAKELKRRDEHPTKVTKPASPVVAK